MKEWKLLSEELFLTKPLKMLWLINCKKREYIMETTYIHEKKTPEYINKQMDKKGLNNLLDQMY